MECDGEPPRQTGQWLISLIPALSLELTPAQKENRTHETKKTKKTRHDFIARRNKTIDVLIHPPLCF